MDMVLQYTLLTRNVLANCSKINTGFAISLYLFLEFVPITLFFLCVVLFCLNITAGPLLGYVLFCQLYYTSAVQHEIFIYDYVLSHVPIAVWILTLCGIWDLQFFKSVISPFCISKLTGIDIQMLNLVTAIYPVLLVIITWILMELHARNYRIIQILWKPFSILVNKLKITAVTSDAVIHAFATFILLSATTVSYTVVAIHDSTLMHRSNDGTLYKKVLYYDPTITALSHKHVPCISSCAFHSSSTHPITTTLCVPYKDL